MTARRAITFYELLRATQGHRVEGVSEVAATALPPPADVMPATVEYGVPLTPEAAEVVVAAAAHASPPTATSYAGALVSSARSVAASARKPEKIRSRCCGKVRK